MQNARSVGHSVQVITTATLDFPVLHMIVEFGSGTCRLPSRRAYRRSRIAKPIVSVFPLWPGTIPASLKTFLKPVMRLSVAFAYLKADKGGFAKTRSRATRAACGYDGNAVLIRIDLQTERGRRPTMQPTVERIPFLALRNAVFNWPTLSTRWLSRCCVKRAIVEFLSRDGCGRERRRIDSSLRPQGTSTAAPLRLPKRRSVSASLARSSG